MITYKLRPDTVLVKIDHEAKAVTNVVNKVDQKIISFITTSEYFTRFVADAETWPLITETEFNAAKEEVLSAVNII